MKNDRAVVLLSGGLDAAVMLTLARRERTQVYALTFDYGQHHDAELNMAVRQAEAAGVDHRLVVIDPTLLGESALTLDVAVPQHVWADKSIGRPTTYVPARNSIMLSFALALAESVGAYKIYIGANLDDRDHYPDCSPEFFTAFTRTAALGTWADDAGQMEILAPLLNMAKHQIILLGKEIGVDFALTSSCYAPLTNGRPCGGCDACALRRTSFERAGMVDPLI